MECRKGWNAGRDGMPMWGYYDDSNSYFIGTEEQILKNMNDALDKAIEYKTKKDEERIKRDEKLLEDQQKLKEEQFQLLKKELGK